jgi:penicillin-insensitive murein DD-endopeptidase
MPRRALLGLALVLAACGGPKSAPTESAADPAPVAPTRTSFAETAVVSRSDTTPAKMLFGHMGLPSEGETQSLGSYARGCLAGAVALPETGPTWQAMRLSRNRRWGTPQLVAFIERLAARQAREPGWTGIYIGDMSQPRGGPMLGGHASHQIGLDVDIWLRNGDRMNRTTSERENIGAPDMATKNGAYANSLWSPGQMALVRNAAEDPEVARIFIAPGLKVQMCADARGDRTWLRKVRPWYEHREHIHVRLLCPKGMAGCVPQTPPPPGDGCAEAQKWVDNILHPPPPDPNAPKPKPPHALTLADLPAQCATLVGQ